MITVINPNIHDGTKLKKETFLKRLQNVQEIRHAGYFRNLIPCEELEWEFFTELHDAINTHEFHFDTTRKVFSFDISEDHYKWFKNNSIDAIRRQVINWISFSYLSNIQFCDYLDDYIYAPVKEEMDKVIQRYYPEGIIESQKRAHEIAVEVDRMYQEGFDEHIDQIRALQSEFDAVDKDVYGLYETASSDYAGSLPPVFLSSESKNGIELRFWQFGLKFSPKIDISTSYFTQVDWTFIVERDLKKAREVFPLRKMLNSVRLTSEYSDQDLTKMIESGESDEMIRSESDRTAWDKWKRTFKEYDKKKSNVYSLFDKEDSTGWVYILRMRTSNSYKVGWTSRAVTNDGMELVKKRISELQVGCPLTIDHIGHFRASSMRAEKVIHEFLYQNEKSQNGEWFEMSEERAKQLLNPEWRVANHIY